MKKFRVHVMNGTWELKDVFNISINESLMQWIINYCEKTGEDTYNLVVIPLNELAKWEYLKEEMRSNSQKISTVPTFSNN